MKKYIYLIILGFAITPIIVLASPPPVTPLMIALMYTLYAIAIFTCLVILGIFLFSLVRQIRNDKQKLRDRSNFVVMILTMIPVVLGLFSGITYLFAKGFEEIINILIGIYIFPLVIILSVYYLIKTVKAKKGGDNFKQYLVMMVLTLTPIVSLLILLVIWNLWT